ncbi:MAG TPA: ABC transporter permease subunit [Thermoanaerobaculia bacterium]|nr:ABC transporter permease subunit [Thermoanaerobaculia bacterium]
MAAIGTAWELIVRSGMVSPAMLAAPSEIATRCGVLLQPAEHLADVVSTLAYALTAFTLSVPIGVTIGLAIGDRGHTSEPLAFVLDFLRSIPATALVPVFFLMSGVGAGTKLAAGCFSSSLVIALATVHGLRSIPSTRRETADLLRIEGLQRVWLVTLPSAAREILLGCRAGVSLALILVVVAEMLIGGNRGLGRVIFDMRYTDDKPLMYAAILATGIMGYGLNAVVGGLERLVIYWRG